MISLIVPPKDQISRVSKMLGTRHSFFSSELDLKSKLVLGAHGVLFLFVLFITGDELGTATNIKSRVNRLSVLGAITSVQQRLKLYNRVPKNGLVIYCGTILTPEGKDKKVSIDFEPFKPINTSLYLCDNKFHTEVM